MVSPTSSEAPEMIHSEVKELLALPVAWNNCKRKHENFRLRNYTIWCWTKAYGLSQKAAVFVAHSWAFRLKSMPGSHSGKSLTELCFRNSRIINTRCEEHTKGQEVHDPFSVWKDFANISAVTSKGRRTRVSYSSWPVEYPYDNFKIKAPGKLRKRKSMIRLNQYTYDIALTHARMWFKRLSGVLSTLRIKRRVSISSSSSNRSIAARVPIRLCISLRCISNSLS